MESVTDMYFEIVMERKHVQNVSKSPDRLFCLSLVKTGSTRKKEYMVIL